jgi:hypothetical protein
MKLPPATQDQANAFVFNRQSILNAIRELQLDFHEGPKEAVMQCFITPDCASGKVSLYLNILDKPGVFHCFKCNQRGYFADFVKLKTNWGEFKLVSFLRKHRPTTFEVEVGAPQPKQYFTETDVTEGKYAYRHAYCYDRKINEETLRRYRVGYDKKENDIIFPWYNRVGRMVAIKRRAVMTKYYRFECNESIMPLLYGLHLVRPCSIVALTEGEFDAMYMDQAIRAHKMSFFGAVALGGKYLHKAAQDELMLKTPRLVVLALDNDKDGDKAASTIAEQLAGIVPTYRFSFESGVKDPNESAIEHIAHELQNAEKQYNTLMAVQQQRYTSYLEKRQA